jgi:hypothetical protein
LFQAGTSTSVLKFSREVSSDDDELEAALALSLQRDCKTGKVDDDLQAALIASLGVDSSDDIKTKTLIEDDNNDLEKVLKLSLNVKNDTEKGGQAEKQEDELEKALKLSLECECGFNKFSFCTFFYLL